MTFEDACYLIKHLVDTVPYRVLLRYRSNQQWSFKFERNINQYDALEILFMHLHGRDKPDRVDAIYMKVQLTTADSIAFINLASGGWKHPLCMKDERYDNYRQKFTDITGIPLR